jgi:anti-anti-sigma factor
MDALPQALRFLPGSITLEQEPGGLQVLRLRGDVDSAVVAEFQLRQGRAPVVLDAIDAGAVTFVGSAGLALMVRCAETSLAAAHQPVLRATSPPMDRLLEQVGMEHLFRRP